MPRHNRNVSVPKAATFRDQTLLVASVLRPSALPTFSTLFECAICNGPATDAEPRGTILLTLRLPPSKTSITNFVILAWLTDLTGHAEPPRNSFQTRLSK